MAGDRFASGAWSSGSIGYIPVQTRASFRARARSASRPANSSAKSKDPFKNVGRALRLSVAAQHREVFRRYSQLQAASPAAPSSPARKHGPGSVGRARPHSAPGYQLPQQSSHCLSRSDIRGQNQLNPVNITRGMPFSGAQAESDVRKSSGLDDLASDRLTIQIPQTHTQEGAKRQRPHTAPCRPRQQMPTPSKKNIREIRALLDASLAPSMLQLRNNTRNMIKRNGWDRSPSPAWEVAETGERLGREAYDQRFYQGETPIHQDFLWRLKRHKDPSDPNSWWQRDFWLSRKGDLCYQSVKHEEQMILCTAEKLSEAKISRFHHGCPSGYYAFVISIPTELSGSKSCEEHTLACDNLSSFSHWMAHLGVLVEEPLEKHDTSLLGHGRLSANSKSDISLTASSGKRLSWKNDSNRQAVHQPPPSGSSTPSSSAFDPTPRQEDEREDVPLPVHRRESQPRRRSLVYSMLAEDPVASAQVLDNFEAKRTAVLEELQSARYQACDAVFERFQDDGEVHRDDMMSALKFLSYLQPSASIIDEISNDFMTTYSTLDHDEFIKFVGIYKERHFQTCAEAFDNFITDSEGLEDVVPISELAPLLKSCGITVIPRVLKEILGDLVPASSIGLTLENFKEVLEVLQLREGFSVRDLEFFRTAFKRFDRAGVGRMHTKELSNALTWLGYTQDDEDMADIGREVDVGAGASNLGGLSDKEFIICCRKIRDRDLARMEEVLIKYDSNQSGGIDKDELNVMLRAFDYIPNQQVIEEVAEEVGASHGCEFDLFDLLRFLEIYRAREGLTHAETQEIDAVFSRYDPNRSGEIHTVEIGKVLRWMGYLPSYDEQQHLVAEVDVDQSKRMSLPELAKLVRKYREREVRKARNAFTEYDFDGTGLLIPDRANQALQSLGCEEEAPLNQVLVGVFDFINLVSASREKKRIAFREFHGFADEEVTIFKRAFVKYDTRSIGRIVNSDIQAILEEVFPPDVSVSANKLRPYMRKLLREVNEDGSGTIDFPDFLRLMRGLYNLQEQDWLVRERRVVRQTGFARSEVEEFRELFTSYASGEEDGEFRNELTLPEVKRMIGTICPLGTKRISELSEIYKQIASEDGDGKQRSLHFPEFLLLMRRLLDMNFAGIREQSEKVVSKVDKKKS